MSIHLFGFILCIFFLSTVAFHPPITSKLSIYRSTYIHTPTKFYSIIQQYDNNQLKTNPSSSSNSASVIPMHSSKYSFQSFSWPVVLSILSSFVLPKTSWAKDIKGSTGWDLIGRVPYDDWLFTNEKLLDPNLLKRTLIECVSILLLCHFFSF